VDQLVELLIKLDPKEPVVNQDKKVNQVGKENQDQSVSQDQREPLVLDRSKDERETQDW
jgi:hypothetical protein